MIIAEPETDLELLRQTSELELGTRALEVLADPHGPVPLGLCVPIRDLFVAYVASGHEREFSAAFTSLAISITALGAAHVRAN